MQFWRFGNVLINPAHITSIEFGRREYSAEAIGGPVQGPSIVAEVRQTGGEVCLVDADAEALAWWLFDKRSRGYLEMWDVAALYAKKVEADAALAQP